MPRPEPLEGFVDCLSQRVEVAAQGVGVRQQVAPDFAFQLLPADDARRRAHEDRQQLQADRHQLDRLPGARDLQRGDVDQQIADAQGFGDHRPALATQQGADSRFEFPDLERLDEVVVRTSVEACDLVVHGIARGQHQQWRVALRFLAQLAAEGKAIHPGQHQVQDDRIVVIRYREMQTGHAVAGVIHGIAFPLQELDHHLRDVAVVLDQKDDRPGGVWVQWAHLHVRKG